MRAAGADLGLVHAHEENRIHAGVGILGSEFQAAYAGTFARIDPYFLRASAAGWIRAGTIGLGEELIPLQELRRTEFYNEFARHHDYLGGLSAVVAADESVFSVVSLCRRKERGFGTAEMKFMRLLLPHFRRALQVHRRFAEAIGLEVSFAEMLNQLRTGAILIRPADLVWFVNDSARDTLNEQDGLTIDHGVLRAARAEDHASLRALVRGITTGTAADPSSGGVLQVRRPSGRRPLQLTVSRLPSRAGTLGIPAACAVVFVIDPERVREADPELLRRLYGLTRMEAEIARLLLQDKNVREIADRLGIRQNSVRFHLKHLFVKTETRRQSELVSLLMGAL
jgi:DNA-binding CsgD family transcriptional regulator